MRQAQDSLRWLRWLVLDHLLLIVVVLMIAAVFSVLFLRSKSELDHQNYELQRSIERSV
ncbi:hypothetical protein QA646_30105 (plasmid) [Rhizobium sp. CB3090]|uniref:hypothetical protein n=1 Tax=Rhizobium sp. CB3090 TaxID=3039156 RepID=UPI0024B1E219|nr:hypothetical protein [Rhizobium sp. CB3090]WFU13248.1 hypothetical protein QA646_30105 [Rhizobium sp. CB3090]